MAWQMEEMSSPMAAALDGRFKTGGILFINKKSEVKIIMTLTSPSCPVAESLPEEVRLGVEKINGVKSAEVEITFEPPWEKSMMSEEAKLELGFL